MKTVKISVNCRKMKDIAWFPKGQLLFKIMRNHQKSVWMQECFGDLLTNYKFTHTLNVFTKQACKSSTIKMSVKFFIKNIRFFKQRWSYNYMSLSSCQVFSPKINGKKYHEPKILVKFRNGLEEKIWSIPTAATKSSCIHLRWCKIFDLYSL